MEILFACIMQNQKMVNTPKPEEKIHESVTLNQGQGGNGGWGSVKPVLTKDGIIENMVVVYTYEPKQ